MSLAVRYTFNKSERLTHKPTINHLFSGQNKNKRLNAYPLSLVFFEVEPNSDSPAQVLISVPKKKLRKAVQRNRIKRLVREAYRLQKHELYKAIGPDKQIALAIVYLKDELSSFASIQKAVTKLLNDLSSSLS